MSEPTSESRGEEWRPVVGFDGLYEVSTHGVVRRVGRARGTAGGPLKTHIGNHGYPSVTLCKNCVRSERLIHRLVAESFIGECPPGMDVNHKDGNKLNSNATNLEYVSKRDNSRHAARSGLLRRRTLSVDQVLEIRRRYSADCGYGVLASEFGVVAMTIKKIVTRKTWKDV